MADKTVSLNSRQVNTSLRTRIQAGDYQLKKQKVDLDTEKKYSSQQMDMKQRVLQDKLRKLRMRQQVVSAMQAPKDSKTLDKSRSSQLKSGALLQPLDNVVNPYPVTFEKTGKQQIQRHLDPSPSLSLPKLPDIPSNQRSTRSFSSGNSGTTAEGRTRKFTL